MLSLAQAFLDNAEFQVAVIGVLTWVIMFGLKKVGVLPQDGADWPKRLIAALSAGVIGFVGAFVAHQVSGDAIDAGKLIAAMLIAWFGATGLHTVTRPKKVKVELGL